MYNRLIKTIAIPGTITLIFLGSTITAKAMWENLNEEQRNRITVNHNNYKFMATHVGGSPDHSYDISYWTHRRITEIIQRVHMNDVQDCPLCQREVMATYCQNIFLEVEGLKDDVQRLKAELRAATERK